MKQVTILGATGSIGQSTLDVIGQHPDLYSVYAITANTRIDILLEQIKSFEPQFAVVVDPLKAKELTTQVRTLKLKTEVLSGVEALAEVAKADAADMVMAAIVGAAGLLPTLAAAEAGKRVLLANKEALVMSGKLFMDAVTENGAELLPIDSEHNAIFQCLPKGFASQDSISQHGIRKVLLTASGGPFRTFTKNQLQKVTPKQAVAHPNWSMGQKISVDSATLMNKGLELVEACWLFNLNPDDIEVVIHPQSTIHSMVQYVDGSVIAQMGNPDMRTPIAYGMAWPSRLESGVKDLDFFALGRLDFEQPNHELFPSLKLAGQSFKAGGTAMAILNAANEVAVDAFLNEVVAFSQISEIVDNSLQKQSISSADSIENILAADEQSRLIAREFIRSTLV